MSQTQQTALFNLARTGNAKPSQSPLLHNTFSSETILFPPWLIFRLMAGSDVWLASNPSATDKKCVTIKSAAKQAGQDRSRRQDAESTQHWPNAAKQAGQESSSRRRIDTALAKCSEAGRTGVVVKTQNRHSTGQMQRSRQDRSRRQDAESSLTCMRSFPALSYHALSPSWLSSIRQSSEVSPGPSTSRLKNLSQWCMWATVSSLRLLLLLLLLLL